jgi:hypothetical protein
VDRSGISGIGAEDRPRDLRSAGTEQARKANNLAFPHLDASVLHLASDPEPFGRQHDVAHTDMRSGKFRRMSACRLRPPAPPRRD